jgi:hypothetical protein
MLSEGTKRSRGHNGAQLARHDRLLTSEFGTSCHLAALWNLVAIGAHRAGLAAGSTKPDIRAECDRKGLSRLAEASSSCGIYSPE